MEVYTPHSKPRIFIFGSTKPTVAPWNGDRVSPWNVGELSHLDAAVYPRYYWRKVVLWMPQCIWSGWQHSFTHFWSKGSSDVSSHMYQPQGKWSSTHWVASLVDPRTTLERSKISYTHHILQHESSAAQPIIQSPEKGQSMYQERGEMSYLQILLDSYHLT